MTGRDGYPCEHDDGVETDAVRVMLADELTATKAERDTWRHVALEAQEVAHAAMAALDVTQSATLGVNATIISETIAAMSIAARLCDSDPSGLLVDEQAEQIGVHLTVVLAACGRVPEVPVEAWSGEIPVAVAQVQAREAGGSLDPRVFRDVAPWARGRSVKEKRA